MKTRLLLVILMLICASGVSAAVQETPDLTPPQFGTFDPASVEDIDLMALPLIPSLTDHARSIFERGQAAGRNPRMFSKVGDSMTASPSFLTGFAGDDYDLGEYPALQAVVDYFNANGEVSAFDRPNYATEPGFSTTSALDPTWANPEVCEPNESPLVCEYRALQSAFALIMFGTNDVIFFDDATYDYFLRTVVLETIAADIVPVLYTFPVRPEEPEKSAYFNRIMTRVAQDYDLPLVNLYAAVDGLADHGVDLADPLHMTQPENPADVTRFDNTTLQAGYTVRNLLTLQTLDALLGELGEIR